MPPHDQVALKRILFTKIITTLFIFLRGGLEEGREGKERKAGEFCILNDPIQQINKASFSGYLLSKTSPTLTAFLNSSPSSPEIELLTPPKVKTFLFLPKTQRKEGKLAWEWFSWTLQQTCSQPFDHNLGASLSTLSLQVNCRDGPHGHKNSTKLPYSCCFVFFFRKFSGFMGLHVSEGLFLTKTVCNNKVKRVYQCV